MRRIVWSVGATAAVAAVLASCGPRPAPPQAISAPPPQNSPANAPEPEERAPAQISLASFQGVEAKVAPYSVSPGFKEVTNYSAFKKTVPLTPKQEELLRKNLFAVAPVGAEQLFYLYENNDYLNLPSFVSTDLVLQVYHVFYDFTLRTVETDALLPALKRLTTGMLQASQKTWKELPAGELKDAALKNVAYFGVAARNLGLEFALPAAAAEMVKREASLIDAHEGLAVGAIFPYKLDYSQFVPRGHYTRSEALKRFFRAMMWYGLAPLAVEYRDAGSPVQASEQIQQGLLLVSDLHRSKLDVEWDRVYEPTAFYVGAADDLTPAEWKKISDRVFGEGAAATAFGDDAKLTAFVEAVRKEAPAARIQSRVVLQDQMPAPEVQLRFMGQRYIPDGEIIQRLVKPTTPASPGRPFPSGLDVMAVLGSPRAGELLDKHADVYNADGWPDYHREREKLGGEFASLPKEQWSSNLYWGWLGTLQTLLSPVPEGFPAFMRTEAWQDKSLNTALASWSELRHDTILYAKQSGAECGGGEEPPFVKGYVEPNVPFYDRLLELTKQSREGLEKRKLLSGKVKSRFEEFDDLLTFLKRVSEKELRNEKLTEEEYLDIRYIGGKIEYLTLSVTAGEPTHWELLSETDKDMAVIADVHTEAATGQALEEAVGHANEILVIVPIEGKLVLTRGAVFSYYEFKQPAGDRLTDEAWQKRLKAGDAPPPPIWTGSFLAPRRPPAMRKEGLEVYSTGC